MANRGPGADLTFLRSASLTTVIQRKIEQMILSEELRASERLNGVDARADAGRQPQSHRGSMPHAGTGRHTGDHQEPPYFFRRIDLQRAMDIYDIRVAPQA